VRREHSFRVGEQCLVEVSIASAGDVQLVTGDPGTISVTIESADADGYEVTQLGDTVSVFDSARWFTRSRNARVMVVVPHRAEVSVKTTSAEATLRGVFGAVRIRSSSGDVRIEEVDRLDVSTTSGDIRVGVVHGDAGFKTASGDVDVNTAHGRLGASMASGDLIAGAVGSSVEVGTASGDVTIGRCDGDDIAVKTISGNIAVGLPTGIRVQPDISTVSGSVSLPQPAAGPNDTPRRLVRLRLRSTSGDIKISRTA